MPPLTNPSNQTPDATEEPINRPPEEVVLSITEPESKDQFLKQGSTSLIVYGGSALTVISLGLAIWQGTANYYLIFVFFLVATFSLIAQHRTPYVPVEVIFSNYRLQIGNKDFPLEEVAGFWLENDGEIIIVNIEMKKPTMNPLNFIFPSQSKEEARSTLSEVLPELEPRVQSFADRLNRSIRL